MEWIGDKHLELSSLLEMKGTSTSTIAIHKLISGVPIVHKTARASHSVFFYSLHLSPGPKVLRFHFNPTPYKGFKGFRDLFTVEAGPFTLLGNFSASYTAEALGVSTFTKEFYIDIEVKKPLRITFSPDSRSQDRTFVFINGIEITSIPAYLSYFQGGDFGAKLPLDYIGNSTAFQITEQVNFIGDAVSSGNELETHGVCATVPRHKDMCPLPPTRNASRWISWIFASVISHKGATGTIAVTIIIVVIGIRIHKFRGVSEANHTEEENKPSARAEGQCRRFSLDEIKSATNSFSSELFIARGGFGDVYEGRIDNGQQIVAIKRRCKYYSRQGSHEFLTEIETLSAAWHINLVSLIGYCNECREMVLVYEYMCNGTLSDHLYKLPRKNGTDSSLTWKQRLNICIGAAQGLDYLHMGHGVIHRDIKTSNILLDENFKAKVADFGLAKHKDRSKSQSHVSTDVKGTFGYLDPYYVSSHKLTEKSDIYAFGVVLLQVLCGRPATDRIVGEDECSLTKWALNKINKGEVLEIVDLGVIREISSDSLNAFVQVAESCLHDEPKKRLTMAQVVVKLEFALELNERGISARIVHEISPSNDEGLICSTDQAIVVSSDVQTGSHPPVIRIDKKSINNEPLAVSSYALNLESDKPLRLGTWNAILNRRKSSKRKASLSDEPLSASGLLNGIDTIAPPPPIKGSSSLLHLLKKRTGFSDNKMGSEPEANRKLQTVTIKVKIDCHGCERQIRNGVCSIKGARAVHVDREKSKVTVTGYMEPEKVLNKLNRLGKKAEFWPYIPYDLVASPYVPREDQLYRNTVNFSEENLHAFSEDNPNACSVM